MSGARPISEETRRRVLAAMKQLDYYPNAGARALAGRRAGVIGVLMEITEDTQIAEIQPYIRELTAQARKRDYDVMLATERMGAEDVRRLVRTSSVDGLVMMDIESHDTRIPVLDELGVPAVLLGLPDDSLGLCRVDTDNDSIGELAIRELASVGARRVVVVDDPRGLGREFAFIGICERACRRTADALGLPLSVFRPATTRWDGLVPLIEDLPSWRGNGVGVFCRSPQLTQWLLQAMTTIGVRPGDDIAVVGACEDGFARTMHVPLTNVSPMIGQVSASAMAMLFEQIDAGRWGRRASGDGKAGPASAELIRARLTRRATTVPGFAGPVRRG